MGPNYAGGKEERGSPEQSACHLETPSPWEACLGIPCATPRNCPHPRNTHLSFSLSLQPTWRGCLGSLGLSNERPRLLTCHKRCGSLSVIPAKEWVLIKIGWHLGREHLFDPYRILASVTIQRSPGNGQRHQLLFGPFCPSSMSLLLALCIFPQRCKLPFLGLWVFEMTSLVFPFTD